MGNDMNIADVARTLLEGPRGRRLCLELAMELAPNIRRVVFWLALDLDPDGGSVWYSRTTDSGDASPPPKPSLQDLLIALESFKITELDDGEVHAAFARSVDAARYWQEPDGEDALAELPTVRDALSHIAECVAAAPGTQWWSGSRTAEQWVIDWRSESDPAPPPKDAGRTLKQWGQNVRAEEVQAARKRIRNPEANRSGEWWSIPLGLVQTVGQIPAAFDLVEDSHGWEQADVVQMCGAVQTFEVRTAADWIELCRSYPLEVTASRRHDWFRTTGRDGRWVIPDWERVASDWDAVHLTVLGYLSSATRTLEVSADVATVIAGWDPDSTIWLTDGAREYNDSRQTWQSVSYEGQWTRTG